MKFLILDSNSILNRAYYGIKQLSTKSGFYTNGIYGFLNTLEKLKEETNPDIIAMAFDLRAKTFRHKAYEGYKANRKGMPNELAQQVGVLKELLDALGYKIIECEGYEADDILGTIANLCEENNDECVIATGDRDSLQLVSDKTCVRLTTTKFGKPEVTLYDKTSGRFLEITSSYKDVVIYTNNTKSDSVLLNQVFDKEYLGIAIEPGRYHKVLERDGYLIKANTLYNHEINYRFSVKGE